MFTIRSTAVALTLALTMLGLSSTTAIAADDGHAVNDYSDMGTEYNPSNGKETAGKSNGDDSSSGKAKAESDPDSSSSGGAVASEDGKPYKVDCSGDGPCKVSKGVLVGYETYGGNCLRCHGENAEGSTFAPSLVEQLKDSNQGAFTAAVAGGIQRLDTTTGQYKIMPAWSDNPEVMSKVQQLWAFLKARTDGALPPGRPEAMKKGS